MRPEELTKEIIGAVIEVHKALGPGRLQSAYEECPCHELGLRELAFERQPSRPVAQESVKLDCGYRVDVVVEGKPSDWDRPLTLPSPQRGEGSGLRLPLPCGERAGVRGITRCLCPGGSEVGLLMNAPPPKLRSARPSQPKLLRRSRPGGFHVAVLKQRLRRKVL